MHLKYVYLYKYNFCCKISLLFFIFYITVFILHSHSLFVLFLQIIKKPLGFELTIGHVLEFALADMQPCV